MLRTMLQCWICSYNIRNVFQYQKLGTSLDVGQLIEKNKKHFKLRARDSISHSVGPSAFLKKRARKGRAVIFTIFLSTTE